MLFMDPTLLLIWKVKEPPELQTVFVMASHLGKNPVLKNRSQFRYLKPSMGLQTLIHVIILTMINYL